jgi:hypothetical protein
MKKKGTQYLLLIVVLGIWGVIGFRFYSFISPEEEVAVNQEYKVSQLTLQSAKKNYPVICDYPDPFLKGISYRKNERKNNDANLLSQSTKKEKITKPLPPQFPAVQLAGVISNKQSGKKSAIMILEGKEYSLAAGESVNGLKLSKIFSDSVLVTYQKKNKMIKL